MRERPILWSSPMVLALLTGRKTQTRRIVKPQPPFPVVGGWKVEDYAGKPYAEVGDRLWGRETWRLNYASGQGSEVAYRSDGVTRVCKVDARYSKALTDDERLDRWKPSIFMPRWASRLLHEVTAVRVERLQDITEEDAIAEGVTPMVHESWSVWDPACDATVSLMVEPTADDIARRGYEDVRHVGPKTISTAREGFRSLWESINGPESWASNPWVWVVSFRPV